ncbi:B-cell receptor-associated protein 31 isoform X1 [Pongo pygmaeus]|uniref:B-cell receptor-associated protein 31 isoform X1 n=1 Tax=Pongo pygmaeus TaxID=9600 RepID=UPI00300CE19E
MGAEASSSWCPGTALPEERLSVKRASEISGFLGQGSSGEAALNVLTHVLEGAGNKLTSPCGKPSSNRMSLQWTAVATFLYAEVFVVLLLCIPFISPKRWQKIFKSRLVELVVSYGNTFFVVLIVILVLLVIDAVREIRKYDDVTEKVNLQNNPGAMEHFHMKLFRAQRNLYIAGFSLLLSFLLRRLVTLISQQATLLASNEAFKKQAESASEAAKKYMEENDQLKKGAAVDGGKLDVGNAEVKLEEENRSLKADLQKLKDELASTKQKLEKAENQVLAMRKQSEGLTKEYDRLLEEHAKLQVSPPVSLRPGQESRAG